MAGSHREDVTIREVSVPGTADDPDFRVSVDIVNAVTADVLGHTHLHSIYAEALRQWQPSAYVETVRLLADVDAVPVGRGYVGMPLEEATDKAYVNIWVLPTHRRRGVGTALLRRIEEITEEAARPRHHVWSLSPPITGRTHTARTGAGGVAAEAPNTVFLLKEGFVLEQVERMSRLDLLDTSDRFRALVEQTERASGPAYRVLGWRGFTPDDRLDDMAWMRSRMATDSPSGAMRVDDETWDADRVRATEQRLASDDRYLLTAVAEHVATGRLVAYTVLTVPQAPDRVARQEDTLVTREHRGHRLGTLVKAANLVRLVEDAPQVPSVYTWNAEENRPMLDVNDVLGFRGVGFEGQWERTLPSAR